MIAVEQGSWTGTRIGAHNGVRLVPAPLASREGRAHAAATSPSVQSLSSSRLRCTRREEAEPIPDRSGRTGSLKGSSSPTREERGWRLEPRIARSRFCPKGLN